MKVIYEFKNENYELFFSEQNIDKNIIEMIDQNCNKCKHYELEFSKEINVDLLNFQQYNLLNTKKKKKNKNKEENDAEKESEINGSIANKLSDKNNYKEFLLKCKQYFEENGYIVKNGDLYGGEYLLYLTDKKYTHSMYIVYFIKENDILRDLIKILRISHSIKKNVILILERKTDSFNLHNNIVYVKLYSYK
ncbi:conserved Plasmodium protein, unknown function [Plasmodium berghei]|uniref:tRNA-intron lyase n=2 Tax=Plasmodium berghei TaxID=5821 RepID=A0A509AT29_PLABA|nr:tRNA-splicing endonuclease, putative [Plasmodium berghei ANKA]CXJ28901.1 conserved Plasmodium protein, unknown function [Plasmodium berghei]SCM27064.1 conserved Plasmodium protein, unknown function [Plasmodium berghei]SCN28790.1 conserved Plasmodium protein, unknown function [Plasmodium berghei]SCO63077.1 conserved Plasmodium protein, unknown function [Plasmodium berghei]SCO64537.1 conserved Plasmodium protein, unknown function [Plasmodium berghei]|eukprot:XP_034424436.1 tRNA-splicing endonuclease, putative [Plasmodium berghei ANKA]